MLTIVVRRSDGERLVLFHKCKESQSEDMTLEPRFAAIVPTEPGAHSPGESCHACSYVPLSVGAVWLTFGFPGTLKLHTHILTKTSMTRSHSSTVTVSTSKYVNN